MGDEIPKEMRLRQDILQKIARREKKQQSSLSKHRFIQKTLPSLMQNHFIHQMMNTLPNHQQSWDILQQKKTQILNQWPQTQKFSPFIPLSLLQSLWKAPFLLPKSTFFLTPILDLPLSLPFLTLKQQQQSSIPKYYLKNSSYLITRCSVQQIEKHSQ